MTAEFSRLPNNMRTKVEQEICPLSDLDGFCWAWTGALNSKGYSCTSVAGKSQLAHRVAYELLVAPIEPGLQIDHLCRNKRCINPDHLEVVTGQVNCSRQDRANKTHCKHGHLYTEQNTIWRKRGDLIHRQCRTCQYGYKKATA